MAAGVGTVAPPPDEPGLTAGVDAALDESEEIHVARLLSEVEVASEAPGDLARRLAARVREAHAEAGGSARLMSQFALDSEEGRALMALAEALLRVPDPRTADALIRDKLEAAAWAPQGDVRARLARFALRRGRGLAGTAEGHGSAAALARLTAPVLRGATLAAMRRIGGRFVFAATIEEAVRLAGANQAWLHSFDMLGEAAMTGADAERYFEAYAGAARRVGAEAGGVGVHAADGISVKLSALHPRYAWPARDRVREELVESLRALCLICAEHGIGLNVDAEEAARLELSMEVFERVALDSGLRDWEGFGFVVQAYQTRARALVDWCIDLAHRRGGRLMLRLVKGAYWDSEIKRAQIEGLPHYPVFTRRAHTDVSFIACAARLLAEPGAVYPQFATHNAHSLAAVLDLARRHANTHFEFQCLHGMGEPLYHALRDSLDSPPPVRVYAPVGGHRTLLPYLVRRLLENGANSGFVRRVVDPEVALDALVADPVATTRAAGGAPHPAIPAPCALYGAVRINAAGLDLARARERERLAEALIASRARLIVSAWDEGSALEGQPVVDPSDRTCVVGRVVPVSGAQLERAIERAETAAPRWAATPVEARAQFVRAFADALEAAMSELAALLVREAGKSWPNALAEVREAVDFARYYAAEALRLGQLEPGVLQHGRVAASITPWNFPLAIFTGQCVAALLSGHSVLAKPAEQTPLVAAEAVRLLHEAGVPHEALQLVPGAGESVGVALARDARIASVLFTGSGAVAEQIHRARAALPGDPLLIAETGGQNAMLVDSTALPEQVVADVLASAFDSAGQRCSALRVLCLQEDIATPVLGMLRGAMDELRLGPPGNPLIDIGPVIDQAARDAIEAHVADCAARGYAVYRAGRIMGDAAARGLFVQPTLIEIDSLSALSEECFGPVLHVLRYREAESDGVLDAINALGYGLTFGVHTRIDTRARRVAARVRAGNAYVNRNMIGAVVGVQPFGGDGLSGTGPKAGGPLYLRRLARMADAPAESVRADTPSDDAFEALSAWLAGAGRAHATAELTAQLAFYRAHRLNGTRLELPGPTGEENGLRFVPVGTVAGVAATLEGGIHQMLAAFAGGNRVRLHIAGERRVEGLPGAVTVRLTVCGEADLLDGADVVLCDASENEVRDWRERAAARGGPLLQVWRALPHYPVSALVRERALSINTAAAGGNLRLMALDA